VLKWGFKFETDVIGAECRYYFLEYLQILFYRMDLSLIHPYKSDSRFTVVEAYNVILICSRICPGYRMYPWYIYPGVG